MEMLLRDWRLEVISEESGRAPKQLIFGGGGAWRSAGRWGAELQRDVIRVLERQA